jgi:hypothetical protein
MLLAWVDTGYANKTLKEDEIWVCTRWGWVYVNGAQKVNCFEWQIKDCSNRLHKQICKLEGRR